MVCNGIFMIGKNFQMNSDLSFKSLLRFVGKKVAFSFLIGFIASLSLGFVELLISVFVQIFLVSLGYIQNNIHFLSFPIPMLSPVKVTLILLFIGLLRFIGQFLTSHSGSFAAEYLNSRLKALAVNDLLFRVSNEYKGVSEINYRISELFPKTTLFMSVFVGFFCNFLQCSIILLIMFLTTWKESLLGTAGIFIIGYIVLVFGKKVRKYSAVVPNEQFKLNSGIEKVAKNFAFISIMRTQNQERNKLFESIINYSSHSLRASFLGTFIATFTPFLGIILLVVIIAVSQIYWHTSGLILISFLYLLTRFVQNLSTTVELFGKINSGFTQFTLTLNYFNSFKEQDRKVAVNSVGFISYFGSKIRYVSNENILQKSNDLDLKEMTLPEIHFNDINFSYPSNLLKNIFNQFNLFINSGEHVGVVGVSGSGKSSLLLLLLGILKPISGEIKICSLAPGEYFQKVSNRVGYVGAEPFLIKGSIRENLCYGINRDITELEIWDALELASLKRFVKDISLDYEIHEDQTGLSAGQKQRLCLARALLNKPHLLILDEATANLDEATELEVSNSVAKLKGQCTVIVVSHRPGILTKMDKVVSLNAVEQI